MSALRGHNIVRFLRWARGAGSQIDPTYPIFGEPETATVRRQFATAKQEISALQNAVEEFLDIGTGPQGPAGPANNLTVGSTVTGATNTLAEVTITGAAPNQTLHFTIPRGIQGDPGPPGLDSTVAGPPGPQGNPGPTYTATAPVTLTGTAFGLAASTATGNYTNANITIDGYGRVTTASDGAPGGAGASSALATDTGKFFVNVNTHETFPASGAVAQFTGADLGADANTTVAVDAVGTPALRLRKLMGSVAQTTAGTAGLPTNNMQLGVLEMQAYNNVGLTKMGNAAQIRAVASGNWTGANQGTSVQFFTVKDNSTSLTTAMSITGSGCLVVGGMASDQGAGAVSADRVWAGGEDLKQLIDDLEARITALGG